VQDWLQKNRMKQLILVIFLSISSFSFSQDTLQTKYTTKNKGKFYVYWGGNRESFSKSDIRFTGNGYDFTVQDAVADDKPKGWHVDYVNPGRMTIPQTNFRIGYFLTDKYNVSIGVDHMKYVMRNGVSAKINGNINLLASDIAAVHNGVYNNNSKVLTEDFLTFEHTDGLNYVNAEVCRFDDISKIFKLPNTDKFQINFTEGIGAGVLYPKTNTMILGKKRHDDFHVSGYGFSAKAALNFTFFKYFFIQTELKAGYINMNDVKTTFDDADKASQSFWFLQRVIAFGGIFRL
jgi:hypothetical protein